MKSGARGLRKDRKKKLFRGALASAMGTLTSRILGLLRDVAMAALFDRAVTDAWAAAFRIPNFFRRLVADGAISMSFIPVFMEVSAQARSDDARRAETTNLVNTLYSLFLISFGVLTLLGIFFIEPLFAQILSANFQSQPEKWEMTLRMGRIMLGFVFFVGTYAYFTAILNAFGSFGVPAVATALLNVSMLCFTFMPGDWFGHRGDNLAWGVLVGGILQALLLAGVLAKKGCLPRLGFRSASSLLSSFLRKFSASLGSVGLVHLSPLIMLYFASGLQEGVISAIYWADRLIEFPLSIVSVSLGTALLPRLSRQFSLHEESEFRVSSHQSFLLNLLFSLPAAAGLYFLAEPFVEILFKRGQFQESDLVLTAFILKLYALSLVFVSCNKVFLPMYLAQNLKKTPLVITFAGLVLQATLSYLWVPERGVQGLILALVVSQGLTALGFYLGLRKRSFFKWQDWGGDFSKIFLGLMAMGIFLFFAANYLQELSAANRILTGLTVLTAGLIYVGVCWLLGLAELLRRREPE